LSGKNHTIEAALVAYIWRECLPKNECVDLDVNDNLFERGIVDSAGLISFISFVEQEFKLTIPDEDLLPQNFASIASIARYIRLHKEAVNAND
jgi:acyl carrier protein